MLSGLRETRPLNHEDGERLDRALSDLMKEGQRIYDFNERLNHAIEDVVRKK
jgi:hypothetical protein